MTRIQIAKQNLKFSAAHTTVFPDGTKEPLHGHNYQVRLDFQLVDSSFEKMISFSEVKKKAKEICDSLDESILIAEENPFVKLNQSESEIEAVICGVRYVFPRNEVRLLKVQNISCEDLARWFCEQMNWNQWLQIRNARITIEESPNQGASFEWSRT